MENFVDVYSCIHNNKKSNVTRSPEYIGSYPIVYPNCTYKDTFQLVNIQKFQVLEYREIKPLSF